MRETVTEKEKAVLDAIRMGATISVLFTTDSREKVDEYLESFDAFEPDREYIQERSSFVYPYIGFAKHYDKINVSVQVSLMLKGGEEYENLPK